jgi:uncharacterized membrane protein YfcA
MTRPWSIVPLVSPSGLFVRLLVGQTGWGGGALMTPILVLLFGVTSYGNPPATSQTSLIRYG